MRVVQSVRVPEAPNWPKVRSLAGAGYVWVFQQSSRGTKSRIDRWKSSDLGFPLHCLQYWQGCLSSKKRQESVDMHEINFTNFCLLWCLMFPWLLEEGRLRHRSCCSNRVQSAGPALWPRCFQSSKTGVLKCCCLFSSTGVSGGVRSDALLGWWFPWCFTPATCPQLHTLSRISVHTHKSYYTQISLLFVILVNQGLRVVYRILNISL